MDEKEKFLYNLYMNTKDCQKCKLGACRNRFVFGEGNPNASVMFIGEGPGKQEDLQGRPFVGPAGELLTAIIEKGMKIPRNQVYIGNVVKCRPTIDLKGFRDRPPEKDEVSACSWILLEQINIIRPKIIVTLGNPATKFLLNTEIGITKMRGTFNYFHDIPVIPTYHPSYILRNDYPGSTTKRETWEDIKKVIKFLSGNTNNEKA
jgi:DNA polymerase